MADYDIASLRAAGYSNAEIEEVLAMSGHTPKEVAAALGTAAPNFNPLQALQSGVQQLLGTAETGPVQAMTRVTHTPVRWGGAETGSYGAYYPSTEAIRLDPERLPQWNANDEYMGNVLRHEQVHALITPEIRKHIEAYFDANPAIAASGRAALGQIDSSAGATNSGLAAEAPAYAVQGYRFGMPDLVGKYQSQMPEPVRQKYQQLLPKGKK